MFTACEITIWEMQVGEILVMCSSPLGDHLEERVESTLYMVMVMVIVYMVMYDAVTMMISWCCSLNHGCSVRKVWQVEVLFVFHINISSNVYDNHSCVYKAFLYLIITITILFKFIKNIDFMNTTMLTNQSGMKCGVGSQRTFAMFSAHSVESTFLQQKVPYFNVSRQNSVKHC